MEFLGNFTLECEELAFLYEDIFFSSEVETRFDTNLDLPLRTEILCIFGNRVACCEICLIVQQNYVS